MRETVEKRGHRRNELGGRKWKKKKGRKREGKSRAVSPYYCRQRRKHNTTIKRGKRGKIRFLPYGGGRFARLTFFNYEFERSIGTRSRKESRKERVRIYVTLFYFRSFFRSPFPFPSPSLASPPSFFLFFSFLSIENAATSLITTDVRTKFPFRLTASHVN